MTATPEEANAELYAAFESGDYDRLAAVWADDDVSCVHPGWPPLVGHDRVLRSWALIMANTSYMQFFLTDVDCRVSGTTAVVTCIENILMDNSSVDALERTVRVAATNIFEQVAGRWLLVRHHGSPVMDMPSDIDE